MGLWEQTDVSGLQPDKLIKTNKPNYRKPFIRIKF